VYFGNTYLIAASFYGVLIKNVASHVKIICVYFYVVTTA